MSCWAVICSYAISAPASEGHMQIRVVLKTQGDPSWAPQGSRASTLWCQIPAHHSMKQSFFLEDFWTMQSFYAQCMPTSVAFPYL